MEIDIRTKEDVVTTIWFADNDSDYNKAVKLKQHGVGFNIVSKDYDHQKILNKQDALNIIKAIQKAIELEWVD
jgi:hypothetical protein